MRYLSIDIKNFKGIEEESLRFNPQFTVLVGDNGTGKTSILDALSVGLGSALNGIGVPIGIDESMSRGILKKEMRKVMMSPDNIEVMDTYLSGTFTFNEKNNDWAVHKRVYTDKKFAQGSKISSLNLVQILKEENKSLPLLVYHSTKRLSEYPEHENSYEKIGSRLDGYYACLDPRSIKKQFISWFKTFEDSALKFNKDKTLYFAFTSAISSMVPGWKDIKFNWGLDELVGQLPNGNWMPLSSLSDGYRGVVGLAAYLAYRSIKLNPHLGENAVKETSGIVLIDELDLHLHPKWQKTIVRDLKRTFPKLQFIVTTHSPFIVQSLKADEIINLDGRVVDEDFTSMDIATTSAFMGVESKHSSEFEDQNQLAKSYIKAMKSVTNDDKEVSELEKLIEESTDPVFKAKMEIEKLTKDLKK